MGINNFGQLGDGTGNNHNTPNAVSNTPATIATIAGGVIHTCALYSKHAACWGNDTYGQLGNGAGDNNKLVPTLVQLLGPDPIAIATGSNHTCALTLNGAGVQCWGQGAQGEVGDGDLDNEVLPVDVIGFP